MMTIDYTKEQFDIITKEYPNVPPCPSCGSRLLDLPTLEYRTQCERCGATFSYQD